MLTLWGSTYRPCDGLTRRDFFKVGALGLGGLTLADLLRLRAQGAADEKSTPKSVRSPIVVAVMQYWHLFSDETATTIASRSARLKPPGDFIKTSW